MYLRIHFKVTKMKHLLDVITNNIFVKNNYISGNKKTARVASFHIFANLFNVQLKEAGRVVPHSGWTVLLMPGHTATSGGWATTWNPKPRWRCSHTCHAAPLISLTLWLALTEPGTTHIGHWENDSSLNYINRPNSTIQPQTLTSLKWSLSLSVLWRWFWPCPSWRDNQRSPGGPGITPWQTHCQPPGKFQALWILPIGEFNL